MTITSWVRILASITMVVFAGATVASATGAFFSSAKSSAGNTFTAGALSLNITGGEISTTIPFTVSNMLPGGATTTPAVFTVTNSAWFRVSIATSTSSNANDVAFAGALTFDATLTDNTSAPVALTRTVPGTFRADSALDPTKTYTLAITTTLPPGTGNAAQDGTATANISLDATQSANQANPF